MNDCETCKHCKPDPEEPYLWVCEITGIALGIMVDCKDKEWNMKIIITLILLLMTGCNAIIPDSFTIGANKEQSYWRDDDYTSFSIGATWYLK